MGNKVLRIDIKKFVNPYGSDIEGRSCDEWKAATAACDTYAIICVKTYR